MRIAVTYGPMCLQRPAGETWNDPRTGSEVGWRRIVEELRKLGHEVARTTGQETNRGVSFFQHALDLNAADCVVSINEPDMLRGCEGKLRICCFWLNEFSFCKEGFDDHVDVYLSPSEAHRQKAIGDWGAPKPEKWSVNYLGCDPPDVMEGRRIPGLVVYCSSPDRGLHRVLESWPHIKRAVPTASLKVFYRLEKWFRGFDTTPYFPPIERLRTRALYVEEALRRLSGPEWGITVVDSVAHDQVLREMAQAEVLVHPCETTSWSEGFSCTVLDACASGACPIVSDCDALGEVYADLQPFKVGDWAAFRERTIRALTDAEFREQTVAKARAIAERLTWARHAKQLEEVILGRIKG